MNSIKVNYWAVGITLVAAVIVIIRLYSHQKPEVVSGSVNLKELLSVSIDLAERGGMITAQIKEKHIKLNAEKKGMTDEGKAELKTDGDMQSHRAIMAGFHKAFPLLYHRIVSEEHDKNPVTNDYSPNKNHADVNLLPNTNVPISNITIWVDPLDATQEYTENLDRFVTVMICVAVNGQPIIGVINRPQDSEEYKKETVWAWVGNGQSSNIGTSASRAMPANPTIIISRSHAGPAGEEVKKAFSGAKVQPAGGAGFKSIEVIRGKADVYAHVTKIKKWDICAGHALLNAVGGEMKTLKNSTIDYRKETSPVNEDGLLAALHHLDDYMNKLSPIFQEQAKKGH